MNAKASSYHARSPLECSLSRLAAQVKEMKDDDDDDSSVQTAKSSASSFLSNLSVRRGVNRNKSECITSSSSHSRRRGVPRVTSLKLPMMSKRRPEADFNKLQDDDNYDDDCGSDDESSRKILDLGFLYQDQSKTGRSAHTQPAARLNYAMDNDNDLDDDDDVSICSFAGGDESTYSVFAQEKLPVWIIRDTVWVDSGSEHSHI